MAEHALLPFLRAQSQNSLTRLYGRPSACLSVSRLLQPLEQQIVMSLLWLEAPVAMASISSWTLPTKDAQRQWEAAIGSLNSLHLISETRGAIDLNPMFRAGLRTAILGGGTHQSFGVPCDKSDKEGKDGKRGAVTIDFLDKHASQKWETILHYMVSSGTEQGMKPSEGVLYLLRNGGLMSSATPSTITSKGFQFLLRPPHAQLWDLLSQFLQMSEDRGMDLVEVLSFLFMLSTMELGQDYFTEFLTETQEVMLEDLRDYGLVYQRKAKSKRFHPTRLATTLTSSLPPLLSSSMKGSSLESNPAGGTPDSQGFIIIETNYRLYAYTDNPLQVAVLNLFVALKSRFPNLVVGALSRESVKRALDNGITADQIISYLTTHAHPMMRKNNPIISSTVQDQIRIWENERNRVRTEEGYLYNDFRTERDYQDVLQYARQLGMVVWESDAKKIFFGRLAGHENIRSFISRRTQSGM
ncbi:hypothetical protein BS47DRAFT_1376069 [Hydnum rufescens UP504]|uniref:RNA polymerase II transcription factor B subunit 2 n=1 Tax=Hydnum rufescens UP504 TaxID=1448309 RepID=A0A9P6B365_9AGAM|nr:hypothetical protein BS47DRAFT_1376069 [Hydnum rufescens UP504]